jgi:hypothetical protein
LDILRSGSHSSLESIQSEHDDDEGPEESQSLENMVELRTTLLSGKSGLNLSISLVDPMPSQGIEKERSKSPIHCS